MKRIDKKPKSVLGICLFLTLFILVVCSAEKNQALQGNLARLQGKWQSDEDNSAIIEIKGDKFISYYGDKNVSAETIEFIDNAEDRQPDPDGEYFIVKGEFDAMIYYLVELSESKLEYTFSERGNTLKYTKLE